MRQDKSYFMSQKQMAEAKRDEAICNSVKKKEKRNAEVIQFQCGCGCGVITYLNEKVKK
jgi:hypothetical protein